MGTRSEPFCAAPKPGIWCSDLTRAEGSDVGTRVTCYLDWEGWAERVTVPTRHLAAIDDRVSFAQAAALPIAGLTTLRALRVGGAVLGRKVLVTRATGGVGQFAVQLAVATGAHVTAQVSGPGREAEARALGAYQVVTSLEDDGLGPFHLVLDGIGGPLAAQAVRRIAPGGHLAWYGNIGGAAELRLADFYAEGWNAHIVGFISPVPEETKGEDLAILVGLVADGRLSPRIGLVVDWEKTPKTLDALARRDIRGKAVITVGDGRQRRGEPTCPSPTGRAGRPPPAGGRWRSSGCTR